MSARDPRFGAPQAGEKMNGREGQAAPPRLIRGGRLIDASGLDRETDLLIAGGLIAEIGPGIAPGPGWRSKTRVGSSFPGSAVSTCTCASRAEARRRWRRGGGSGQRFTGLIPMHRKPPIDDQSQVKFVITRAGGRARPRARDAAVTQGQAGWLTEMAGSGGGRGPFLRTTGSRSGTRDHAPGARYGRMIGPIIDHCEDKDLAGWAACTRRVDRLGLPGIPAAAEVRWRDLVLAELTSPTSHLSTRGSVDLVPHRQAAALRVTCEVTPRS
jgi:dihydroorotase-like cyclic amidohydrolase